MVSGRPRIIDEPPFLFHPPQSDRFEELIDAADVCGWTLARAHARSGDAACISGYLGKSAAFEQSLAAFSRAYAINRSKTTRRCATP